MRAVQAGTGGLQLRASLSHPSLNLLLVELGEHLAFLNFVAVIDVELLHDAAGLRLNLDLGDGLDLSRGHHALRKVSLFDLGEL